MVVVVDFFWAYSERYVSSEGAKVHGSRPEEEGLVHEPGDNSGLTLTHGPNIPNGDDLGSDREEMLAAQISLLRVRMAHKGGRTRYTTMPIGKAK